MVIGPETLGTIWNTGNLNWIVEEKEISLTVVKPWDSGPQKTWDPIPGEVQNQLDKSQSIRTYQ